MLYHFFSTGVIAVFSVLSGILVNVFLDLGIAPAFAFYGIVFLVDYMTTIRVKDYPKYETNRLFGIIFELYGARISFGVIFGIGITVNAISYCLTGDVILCYILGMCHFCTCINNCHVYKKLSSISREQIS